jgi:hypothetical protein
MGLRENIQLFHPIDIDRYLDFLITEKGAKEHPQQAGAYLIDGLPFYKPQLAEVYVFILGFNMVPLSSMLIQALADYPDLAPGNTRVLWTLEQDLIMDVLLDDCTE